MKNVIGILFGIAFVITPVMAKDIVVMSNSESLRDDKRSEHKSAVIMRALELTAPEYGEFELKVLNLSMNSFRALPLVVKGEPINIYVSAERDSLNQQTLAIKIPIRMGLLAYRLLLVHKDNLDEFAKVKTLTDLKALTAGLRRGWTTTQVYKDLSMPFIRANNFEGLFTGIEMQRFDYIPRGVYEVFDELAARKETVLNVVVEPTLVLHIPMYTYIYVSPKTPEIAKRIEVGLLKMQENGELQAIFDRYYLDDIKRANLKNRTLIEFK